MTLPVPVHLRVGHRSWCIGGITVGAPDHSSVRALADLLRATADELDTTESWHEIITREFGP